MKTLENPPKNPTANFLDDYAMQRIEFRARQLARQHKNRGDWQDLRQDMVVEILEAAPRFDPAKASRETFIARVLDRFEIDLYRENARNQEVQCVSLDDPSVERDFLEDCSSVMEPSGQEQTDLSSDVESLIAGLGIVPRPVRIGRSVFWRPEEVAAWIEAGCPDRKTWDQREE